MQTVPSLVGIGTAVAAAATGLVFGQALDSSPTRPPSNRRTIPSDHDNVFDAHRNGPDPSSRPATSSAPSAPPHEDSRYHTLPSQFRATNASRHPRPLSTQFTPPKAHARRHSFIRQDLGHSLGAEDLQDSVSSNGSWMRRLSIRPLSQHGSSRSSVGPDSPSVTFSHGSAAPILSSPVGSLPPQLPPNKLVKRAPNSYNGSAGTVTRRRSRSHLPTLRRPATSHQRSATQQFQQPSGVAMPVDAPKYSLDQHTRPAEVLAPPVEDAKSRRRSTPAWISFFHSRASRSNGRGSTGRGNDSSPNGRPSLPAKRICLNNQERTAAHLVQPSMLVTNPTSTGMSATAEAQVDPDSIVNQAEDATPSPEDTPSKRARRSISMHFPSPTSWISKTGSIRRPKRGQESKASGKRHVSAPVDGAAPTANDEYDVAAEEVLTLSQRQGAGFDPSTLAQAKHRKRNSSSPLPPLSRLSSFNVDLNKLGASATASSQPRQNQPSGSSQSSGAISQYRNLPQDRSSTMNSLDFEGRDFILGGDDDDTDFKSDTMFDSIRTVASGRIRTVETPLESMFDESPPSTAGNTKTKRLSIQEILGRQWDGDDRIMEEDEGISTPVRGTHTSRTAIPTHDLSGSRFNFEPQAHDLSLASRDFGRLSLDDDADDDWAKDDEDPLSNHLSPPNSVNSRAISPSLRMALASIGSRASEESHTTDVAGERPLSNLFDWSEPSIHDKADLDGQSPRPKTVHGKQEMDVRGGRSATRKGPTAAHVRSQSVPVVQDAPEVSKSSATKFGTWGLGTKTASEDWDDDFEFEEAGLDVKEGKPAEKSFAMVVPASIQASQPSVKAHSGQLREFSLLVNDLKRLCRHGKDMDMLNGPHAGLWKEAEGIIALASPDEDAMDGMDGDLPPSTVDPSTTSDRLLDDGFDLESPDKGDGSFEAGDLAVPKTSSGRDRHAARRRSVFSPDDDIFGGSWPLTDEASHPERPRTPENNSTLTNGHDINTVVRSMMEAMQNRSASDPSPLLHGSGGRLHFGSSSLKALVKRAGDLRDALSEIVRRADPIVQSPARTPRRHDNESPAFTRVFADPSSSPPRRLPHSRSNNSVLNPASMDASPSNGINQRMMMTTVS